MGARKKVVVGLSGGVDSSVAALLLKNAGYDVIGLFMRNWHEEDENGSCTAEEDYADVRRVANKLGIPYYTLDLSEEYAKKVFRLFLDEYEKGRTPNPDVLCNSEIKFGPFKEFAAGLGADYVATGHYAGTLKKDGRTYLIRAKDENKDQTYFLNGLTEAQIADVIFPLTEIPKPEVRRIAEENGLATAKKKDSTGICFIGERNFRKFLSTYLPMKKGEIRNLDGKLVKGEKNDAPYYIVAKDVKNNILYVNQGDCPELYKKELFAEDFNYITDKISAEGERVLLRTRHRERLIEATAYPEGAGVRIIADTPVRAVTPGQYAVLYKERICLGGGKIR